MTPLLLDCAVRAVLMAAGTAVVLWAMRIRTAATRHAAWTAVLLAMLVLPIWSMFGGPRLSLRVLRTAPPAPVASNTVRAFPEAVASLDAIAPGAPAGRESAPGIDWQDVLIAVYLLGTCVLLARLAIGTVQAHRLRRRAVIHAGRATSGRCAAPITVGWFAPVLILPFAWTAWPRAQLDAVLIHEAEHARRRDPLVQWLALFNRAVFWFHPLAWWLERRLAILAEEACDTAVLAAGHSPQEYSDYLLDLARSVTRHGRRVTIVGMAMPGSGLTERMRQILDGMPAASVSRTRLVCTVGLCAISSVVFAASTLAPRPAARMAQDSSARSADTPRFDVVSIKPCRSSDLPAEGRGGGAGAGRPSPGRLHLDCVALAGANGGLIQRAYGMFADGRLHRYWAGLHVEGAPSWASADRYTIDAKAEGTPSVEMMSGPMMQALLEDRFGLKVHRESKDVPVYELTVANRSKLRPFDGRCTPVDFTKPNLPAQLEATGACGIVMHDTVVEAPGETIGDFIKFALIVLDRPVIDKTGLTGRFDFHLDLPADDPSGAPDLTSMFAVALQQQAGLKLVPAKGPGEFLVIDYVAQPSPNEAIASQVSASAPLAFDVASIKPTNEKVYPATRVTPTGLAYTAVTLKALIADAYGVKALSLTSADASAKNVLDDRQRYDLVGKADHAVSKAQLQLMLQALLADRFKLALHHDSRIESVYKLTTLSGGAKLQTSAADDSTCGPAPDGGAVCHGITMAAFSDYLTSHLNRVVVDQTSLADRYDFTLTLRGTPGLNGMRETIASSTDPVAAKMAILAAMDDWSSSSIFADIQKQLGLKLDADKAPVDHLVIDHLERPTPNDGGATAARAPGQAK